MKNLYLIRHGQTDANLKNLVCGQHDFPLNANGIEQASNLKKELMGRIDHIQMILISPASRTRETAEIIFPGRKLTVEPKINELDVGNAALWTHEELYHYDARFRTLNRFLDLQYPDGESLTQFKTRISDFTNLYHNTSELIIVGHAGVFAMLSHVLFQIPLSHYPFIHFENGSISRIGFNVNSKPQMWTINYPNDAARLTYEF